MLSINIFCIVQIVIFTWLFSDRVNISRRCYVNCVLLFMLSALCLSIICGDGCYNMILTESGLLDMDGLDRGVKLFESEFVIALRYQIGNVVPVYQIGHWGFSFIDAVLCTLVDAIWGIAFLLLGLRNETDKRKSQIKKFWRGILKVN